MRFVSLQLFAAFILFITSCQEQDQVSNNQHFPVAVPIRKDTVSTVDYVAEIKAFQNIEIRSRIRGVLEEILVDEGMVVQKGQLLFRINSKEFQQELNKAKAATRSLQAELKSAEIEFENTKKLFEKKIIGKPELDLAEAKLNIQRAKVDEAIAHENQSEMYVGFTEIRAPFSGTLSKIPNKVGSLIDEGTLLTTLSDNSQVFGYFNLSERAYLSMISEGASKKNESVQLVLADGSLFEHQGNIETMDSEFDSATGNLSLRARFQNSKSILKHGASGKIRIFSSLKGAMLIPQKCTFEIQGNYYVYVVKEDGQVEMRKITIAESLSQWYALIEGVKDGEMILIEGIQKVKDGDRISFEKRDINSGSKL
jgi:RND family efflux transporter MFP subunit